MRINPISLILYHSPMLNSMPFEILYSELWNEICGHDISTGTQFHGKQGCE